MEERDLAEVQRFADSVSVYAFEAAMTGAKGRADLAVEMITVAAARLLSIARMMAIVSDRRGATSGAQSFLIDLATHALTDPSVELAISDAITAYTDRRPLN